jgi:hypothetical protein
VKEIQFLTQKEKKMFTLENDVLNVTLPEGKIQSELIAMAKTEIRELAPKLYGLNIKINGRVTTGMAYLLGHELAHICKSVSAFDPKENQYFLCISH